MKGIILFIVCITNILLTYGQSDTLRGLQTDIFMHPANSNTAYTLKKREIVYNQSPQGFPLPTWAYYGITDKITIVIDNNFIAGLIIKPHLPVPSINGRFRLRQQNNFMPALAYETMFVYLWVEYDQSTNPYFATWRKKMGWYHHLNASWKIGNNFHIHSSAGFSYADHLRLVNKDTLHQQERFFKNSFSPDLSLGLDYRFKRISFHLNTSYGSTFNYIDNVPRKFEIMYGIRMAPFYKNRYGFLRTFRFEWVGFYDEFRDVEAKAYLPLFIPYLYWQWTIKRK